jgi:uncharacterized membrane protein
MAPTIPARRGDAFARRLTVILTHLAHGFARHWLALANLALGLYIGLPLLAPVLMHEGYAGAGSLIYTVFKPLCHQMPERSFFFFGPQATYAYAELAAHLGGTVPARYIGDAAIGWKVAVCQRDVAIYGTALLAGLAFALLRKRLRPLGLKWAAALTLPMGVDGTGQLFGLWGSTWLSRVITGALFGLMLVWAAFPHLERGMREVRQDAAATLNEWER